MTKLVNGDKWGALRCTDVYREKITERDGAITETWFDWHGRLVCVCGVEKVIRVRDFPGRRKMVDCGCGAGMRKKIEESGTVMSLYVPLDVRNRLNMYAQGKGLTVSKAGVELWTVALNLLED